MIKMKGKVEHNIEMKVHDKATVEGEQQEEQSVQDTQLPNVSPQHTTSENNITIIVKDVSNITAQNINPLIEEDLKKILDQSTLQVKLCDNPILVLVWMNCRKW